MKTYEKRLLFLMALLMGFLRCERLSAQDNDSANRVHTPASVVNQLQGIVDDCVQEKLQVGISSCPSFFCEHPHNNKPSSRVRSPDDTARKLSAAAGYLTAALFLYKYLEPSDSMWGFLSNISGFALGVFLGGCLLSSIYHPVISFFVDTFFSQESDLAKHPMIVNKQALCMFIRNWPHYKSATPVSLHALLDDLYVQYLTQGTVLTMSDEEAGNIIKTIVASCLAVEAERNTRVLN